MRVNRACGSPGLALLRACYVHQRNFYDYPSSDLTAIDDGAAAATAAAANTTSTASLLPYEPEITSNKGSAVAPVQPAVVGASAQPAPPRRSSSPSTRKWRRPRAARRRRARAEEGAVEEACGNRTGEKQAQTDCGSDGSARQRTAAHASELC
jgi:hypothetical protein